MKQLTMTKVLTPLAALAFAFGVQAATVSDGFEAYTADSAMVTNQYGWTFAYGADGADDASVVTAYSGATGPTSRPEAFADNGDNYLKLSTEDGTLFRKLSDTAAKATVGNGLYIDTDVQFTITDPSDSPALSPSSEDKFIIWLQDDGADTNLCVLARQFTDVSATPGTAISNVYKLVYAEGVNTGFAPAITPGAWYRLTVKALENVGTGVTFPAFQVYLNDTLLKAGSGQFIIADGTLVDSFDAQTGNAGIVSGQAYFPAMGDLSQGLEKVGFSGEGALDNIAISQDIPDFLPRQKMSINWDTTVISAVNVHSIVGSTTNTIALAAPGDVIVDTATSLMFSIGDITFVSGSSSDYDLTNPNGWTKTGVTALTLSGNTVTSAAGAKVGGFTIAVEANDNCVLTIEGAGLSGTYVGAFSTFSYAITRGGVTGESVSLGVDEFDALADGLDINCKIGDVITFTVVAAGGNTATLSATSGGTLSDGNALTISAGAHTAGLTVTIAAAKATVDGVGYASFADALSAVTGSGTAKKIVLADGATLSAKAQIAADDDITIDLAGNTITGANGNPVFEVAADGALTITNSTGTGYVLAGTGEGAACISNAGTLNLQAGKFNGTISGGTINVTGGAFTANITGANVPPGMKLGQTTSADAYAWQLVPLATPTVTVTGGANTEATWTVNGDTVSAPATLTEGDTYSVTFAAASGYKFTGTPTTEFSGTAGTENITIVAPNAVAKTYINSIELNKATATVETNTTEQLTATYTATEDDSVTWTSSAPAVATVDQTGLVTAVAAGTATITVSAVNGSGSASCVVTVTATEPTPAVQPIDPSAAGGGEATFDNAEAATAAASAINSDKVTNIPLPASIKDDMTSEQKTAYYNNVEAVANGTTVTIEFTTAGEAVAQASANADAVALDAVLSDVAAAGSGTAEATVQSVPGFYYSIMSTSSLGTDMTEGDRVLGTGGAIKLNVPNKGAAGFYKVKVSPTQK